MQRYLKAMKRFKTREERKSLQQSSNARKAARRKNGRRTEPHDWSDEDEAQEEFAPIPKSPKFRRPEPAPAVPLVDMSASPGASSDGEPAGPESPDSKEIATVISIAPGRAKVFHRGVERDATLHEAIARTQKSSLAVGDDVVLDERPGGLPRISRVLDRRTSLSRPDPGRPDVERVVAANVDHAVIVASVRAPMFRPRLVDRYLVAVQRGGIEPIVCANKSDLLDEEGRADVLATLALYSAIDVPTRLVSSVSGEGVAELRALLEGRTVVFVGQSGVGKSSLLNAVHPELGLDTGRVRRGDGKGRHTTTTSTLVDLGDGSRVIDTPGVRSFGISALDRHTLPSYFPELVRESPGCRYRDCTHSVEPSCGVKDAVEAGRVPRARYDTYRRILASLDE